MTSPTARTLAHLRKLGHDAAVVEKWNPHAKIRQDLFGIIDLLVLDGQSICGIQATSGPNHSARRVKALAEPRLKRWLQHGGTFEVWSWSKRGARGKRKLWELRRETVTLTDFD